MPRGFNDQEKEHIQKVLLEHGRKLFSTYGLKKTSIAELTKAAGIAQGSFYQFYGSKEELFFELLEQEEQAIKQTFLEEPLMPVNNPQQAIANLLRRTFDWIEQNPFLQQLYFEQQWEGFIRKLPPERVEAHFRQDDDLLTLLFEQWNRQGVSITVDTEVGAGILRSIFMMCLHKEEIGEAVYRETVDFLIDSVAQRLVGRDNL